MRCLSRIRPAFVAPLAILSLSLWGTAIAPGQPKPARVTFDEHVLPLLKDKCAGCHSQDKKRGGLIVNNYTALMAGGSSGAAVKPGDPENSLLYKVMAHTQEPFMPPKSPKPEQATLDLIHKWIAAGAPENAGSKVVMPEKPRVDLSLPAVARGKPAGPPPMPPSTLSLEPVVRAPRDTAVPALASSPWAPLLAIAGQKQILLYHSDSLDLLGVLPFPEGIPHVLRFSRNGSLLLAGGGRAGKSGRVVVWNVVKGERVMTLGDETDVVLAADISPDQTRVALGGPGKLVRVYSTRDGKLLQEIKKHTDWVTALEYSPDGVLLATGDRNGGLHVWEAFTGREYFTLRGHTAAITQVSWRADSNILASASEDSTIRLFEMENGNQIRSWGAHGGGTLAVRYHRDGRIVSAGRDRLTKLWDGNGAAQRTFEAFPDVALTSEFTHDGARVLAGDWTGQLLVWNAADGKRVGSLSANPPTSAEQLALAEKSLAEVQKSVDALIVATKTSEAALAKANADLTAARKVVTDTQAAFKVAEQKLNQVQASLATAQAAHKSAQQELKARQTLAQVLAEAAAKVKIEADKEKDNPKLQEALTRTLALSGGAAAEVTLAEKNAATLAQALQVVQGQLAPAQQTFTATQAAMQAAPKSLPTLENAVNTAQQRVNADKASLARAQADLAQASARRARWQAVVSVAQKNKK